jgi:hypothetical protein
MRPARCQALGQSPLWSLEDDDFLAALGHDLISAPWILDAPIDDKSFNNS